jgi:lipooligosaccharide transport system permease protein
MTTLSWHARARPGVLGALLVVEAMSTRSRRNWRGTLITGTVIPICFLAALGLGMGSLVRNASFLGHVSYMQYLAPALLASTALQYAVSEAAEPVLAGFKWQRTYLAVVATPVTAGQLMLGHLLWITVRTTFIAMLFFGAMVAFGAADGFDALVMLPLAVFGAVACAAPVMAFAATIRDGSAFSLLNRLVIVPMALFSGTFFPISQLPIPVQALAWATPLSHAVTLCRGSALGGLLPSQYALHLACLAAWLAAGGLLARWRFRKRLLV